MPPSKAEERAKEIQKRAKHIAERAAEVKEIEAQAQLINLRAQEIENEVITRTTGKNNNDRVGSFTNKEVYLLLLDEMSKKLDAYVDDSTTRMNKHDDMVKQICDKYLPVINQHTEMLAQVCKDLPDKGFCGRVDKMYDEMHPPGEKPLHEKVQTLWYDRSLIKWVLATSIGALIVGSVTLIFGFIKGVF